MKGSKLFNESYVAANNMGEGLKLLDPFTAGKYNESASPRYFDWYYNERKESLFDDEIRCRDTIADSCGIKLANATTPNAARFSSKGVFVADRDFSKTTQEQQICFDMRQTASCNSYLPTTQAIAVTDADGRITYIPGNDQYAIVKNPEICQSYKTTCDGMGESEKAICASQAAQRGCGAYFPAGYGSAPGAVSAESFTIRPAKPWYTLKIKF